MLVWFFSCSMCIVTVKLMCLVNKKATGNRISMYDHGSITIKWMKLVDASTDMGKL